MLGEINCASCHHTTDTSLAIAVFLLGVKERQYVTNDGSAAPASCSTWRGVPHFHFWGVLGSRRFCAARAHTRAPRGGVVVVVHVNSGWPTLNDAPSTAGNKYFGNNDWSRCTEA